MTQRIRHSRMVPECAAPNDRPADLPRTDADFFFERNPVTPQERQKMIELLVKGDAKDLETALAMARRPAQPSPEKSMPVTSPQPYTRLSSTSG